MTCLAPPDLRLSLLRSSMLLFRLSVRSLPILSYILPLAGSAPLCFSLFSSSPLSNAYRWICRFVSSWRRHVTLRFSWAYTTERTGSGRCWRGEKGKERSEIALSWPRKRRPDEGPMERQLFRARLFSISYTYIVPWRNLDTEQQSIAQARFQ